MKRKYLLATLILLLNTYAQAQKAYHGFFLGTNLSSFNPEDKFKNPKVGFNLNYKFIYPISNTFSVASGLGFQYINSSFTRPYKCDSFCLAVATPVYEKIRLSRLSTPISVYYNFINKEKKSFYLQTGIEVNYLNNIQRTSDYQIPGTTVTGTFKGKQNIKFGDNSSIGLTGFAGIGTEFQIQERFFSIELLFLKDISKNKILTLKNIEDDGYFFCRVQSLQFRLGHTFSLRGKDK